MLNVLTVIDKWDGFQFSYLARTECRLKKRWKPRSKFHGVESVLPRQAEWVKNDVLLPSKICSVLCCLLR
eukprot:4739934-Amphidinium_carterae.2